MKNLAALRIFLVFPLVGIALPDAAFLFKESSYHLPVTHMVICGVILVMLLTSFAFKQQKTNDSGEILGY